MSTSQYLQRYSGGRSSLAVWDKKTDRFERLGDIKYLPIKS